MAGGGSLRGASRALGPALTPCHRLNGLGGGGRKHKGEQKAPVLTEFGSLQLPGHLVGDWQGRDTCVLSAPFLPACLGNHTSQETEMPKCVFHKGGCSSGHVGKHSDLSNVHLLGAGWTQRPSKAGSMVLGGRALKGASESWVLVLVLSHCAV